MVFLGLVSYGLYLWHFFLLRIVQREWFGWQPRSGNWILLLVTTLPIVVAAAAASWYLVERRAVAFAARVKS